MIHIDDEKIQSFVENTIKRYTDENGVINMGVVPHLTHEFQIRYNEIVENDQQFKSNHNKKLEDFQEDIEKIKKQGFNPIGVTQIYLENTFIFENDTEATKAFELLEQNDEIPLEDKVVGYWYGKYSIIDEIMDYEKRYNNEIKVHIYWL